MVDVRYHAKFVAIGQTVVSYSLNSRSDLEHILKADFWVSRRKSHCAMYVCGCTGTTVYRLLGLTKFTYVNAPAARR